MHMDTSMERKGPWLVPDPAVTVSGNPIEEPDLDTPRPAANRRTKMEWAGSGNNNTMLGLGTAQVGGGRQIGAYILATRGSAQGITWNYGLKVYPIAHQPGFPDYGQAWFVSFDRRGQKLKQGSLRGELIRVAHAHPETRKHLLPLIQGSADEHLR